MGEQPREPANCKSNPLPRPLGPSTPSAKPVRLLHPGSSGKPAQSLIKASLPSGLAKATYAKELQYAQQAVRLAAKLCQVAQRQLSSASVKKVSKHDESPVTVADYGAQAVVAWCLSQAFPDARLSLVAEEDASQLRKPDGKQLLQRITELVNTVLATDAELKTPLTTQQILQLIDLGGSKGGASGRYWVLDPIDGTRGFLGMRQYSVCLALLQDGEVMFGVLGCPNLPHKGVTEADGILRPPCQTGCLFFAHKGRGAYVAPLWDVSAAATKVAVKDEADLTAARYMEAYEARHSNHNLTAELAQQIGLSACPLRMDSQVKYGLLSRGDANLFMRFPPTAYREKVWDHCAGFIIAQEAGCKVTDGAGKRLDFSKGRYLELQLGIIAAPPKIHAAVLEGLKQISGSSKP